MEKPWYIWCPEENVARNTCLYAKSEFKFWPILHDHRISIKSQFEWYKKHLKFQITFRSLKDIAFWSPLPVTWNVTGDDANQFTMAIFCDVITCYSFCDRGRAPKQNPALSLWAREHLIHGLIGFWCNMISWVYGVLSDLVPLQQKTVVFQRQVAHLNYQYRQNILNAHSMFPFAHF